MHPAKTGKDSVLRADQPPDLLLLFKAMSLSTNDKKHKKRGQAERKSARP